jgi:hypothetical protein
MPIGTGMAARACCPDRQTLWRSHESHLPSTRILARRIQPDIPRRDGASNTVRAPSIFGGPIAEFNCIKTIRIRLK